ncbi:hypothetical protein Bbelb_083190 [Branchiostoma belcheri]|nr:hypothetical protein Bbelb_083190 [Branchiostoma belcheri]
MIRSWIYHLKRVYAACFRRPFGSKAAANLLEASVDWSSQPPARLRGRPFLVGSGSPGVPEFLQPPREGFPPVYVPAENGEFSPEEWAVAVREATRDEAGVGAVLFRGMPLRTAKDFSRTIVQSSKSYPFMVTVEPQTAMRIGSAQLSLRSRLNLALLFQGNVIRENPREFATVYCFACNSALQNNAFYGDLRFDWSKHRGHLVECVNSLALKPMSYEGGAAKRENVESNIIFYCQQPAGPGQGGETVMVDVREIFRNLDSAVVDKFRKLGIRYYRYMPERGDFFHGYNSWKETFRTESRDDVEKYMTSQGMTWQWGEDGSISWWYNLPAMKLYKGEWLWFCQPTIGNADFITAHPDYDSTRPIPPHLSPFNSQYGDGSDIEPEVLQHIRDVTWQAAVGFQMKRRDVLVLNNMYTQHGRLGYTGDRKLLVYLAESSA